MAQRRLWSDKQHLFRKRTEEGVDTWGEISWVSFQGLSGPLDRNRICGRVLKEEKGKHEKKILFQEFFPHLINWATNHSCPYLERVVEAIFLVLVVLLIKKGNKDYTFVNVIIQLYVKLILSLHYHYKNKGLYIIVKTIIEKRVKKSDLN